eukprot:TRINITY_DN3014_c0_g2_i1.p1 TRINITY_DN3014_c0_g2~~TRINITY_DN3014_c0_g2_i1.p1  ORF type:complete len:800 (-),score=115.00 TRINITY_DN3014_c0_g2_i1:15-2414(-)
MDEVFPKDVCEEILRHCGTFTSALIALTCKSAPQRTWSLVTSVDIHEFSEYSFQPYDSIVQYTTSTLREIELRNVQDAELILTHLKDHCPRLEKLTVEQAVFPELAAWPQLVADILPRLSSLVIDMFEVPDWGSPESDDSPEVMAKIFKLIRSPIKLEELRMSFLLPEEDMKEWKFSDVVLSKLPSLRRLDSHIPIDMAHKVLPALPKLELLTLDIVHPGYDPSSPSDEHTRVKCEVARSTLREFVTAPALMDLSFYDEYKSVDIIEWLHQQDLPSDSILEVLSEVGWKIKLSAGAVHSLLKILSISAFNFDQLFQQILSNHYALLPTRDELVPHASSLFEPIASVLEPQSIRLFVDIFGPVKPNPRAFMPKVIREFSLDRAECLYDLKIIDADALTGSDYACGNLFSQVTSGAAFDWLTGKMPKSEAERLLRERPSRRQNRYEEPVCPAIKYLPLRELVQRVREFSPSLLANPDEEEFLLVVSSAIKANSVEKLQIIVEWAGPQTISADILGAALGLFCKDGRIFEMPSFVYWLQLLDSQTAGKDPNLFHNNMIQALLRPRNAWYQKISTVLQKFCTAFVKQARDQSDSTLSDAMTGLAQYLLYAQSRASGKRQKFDVEQSDVDTLLRDVFTPLVITCRERKLSLCAAILPAVLELNSQKSRPAFRLAESLFAQCASSELETDSVHSLNKHLKFAEALARQLGAAPADNVRVVQKWLNRVDPRAMNAVATGRKLSLMEEILCGGISIKFSDLPALIPGLVIRGCRVSDSSEYRERVASKKAYDLYVKAVSSVGSQSSR